MIFVEWSVRNASSIINLLVLWTLFSFGAYMQAFYVSLSNMLNWQVDLELFAHFFYLIPYINVYGHIGWIGKRSSLYAKQSAKIWQAVLIDLEFLMFHSLSIYKQEAYCFWWKIHINSQLYMKILKNYIKNYRQTHKMDYMLFACVLKLFFLAINR